MFHGPINAKGGDTLDMPSLLEVLAQFSSRPRYAFMVLNLIAQVARTDGSAGPTIFAAGSSVTLRDWLCDALTPMGQRDPRRIALEHKVRDELRALDRLPSKETEARAVVDDEIRARVRASGKTNVSRAVSELVKAGLLTRHYQGYRVDHHNRGAKRQAVYTLAEAARGLMRSAPAPSKPMLPPVQGELLFG